MLYEELREKKKFLATIGTATAYKTVYNGIFTDTSLNCYIPSYYSVVAFFIMTLHTTLWPWYMADLGVCQYYHCDYLKGAGNWNVASVTEQIHLNQPGWFKITFFLRS